MAVNIRLCIAKNAVDVEGKATVCGAAVLPHAKAKGLRAGGRR